MTEREILLGLKQGMLKALAVIEWPNPGLEEIQLLRECIAVLQEINEALLVLQLNEEGYRRVRKGG